MRRWGILLAGLLILGSCAKETIAPSPESSARLKSVTPSLSTLVLPVGGSASLPFTVKDAGFSFNHTVSSPLCQVRLLLPDGTEPVFFALQGIAKGDDPGSYVATIADRNLDREYVEEVTLNIIQRNAETGTESYVASVPFRVQSEGADTEGVILKTGLPVVYVNTEKGQGVYSKEEYVPAQFRIKGTDQYEGLRRGEGGSDRADPGPGQHHVVLAQETLSDPAGREATRFRDAQA